MPPRSQADGSCLNTARNGVFAQCKTCITQHLRLRKEGLHAGNVLLTSSNKSPHGFEAKISDFGLARDIGTATKLETRTYGTITHMAPEVLASDYISKVSIPLHVDSAGAL